MTNLMEGFPPAPDGQVTLANWRNPPFSRWAFQHVRELIPTADIANDPSNVRQLGSCDVDFRSLRIDCGDRGSLSLDAFLAETSTDGMIILHRGRKVLEHYANAMMADAPHILLSVSKCILGLLDGAHVSRGLLNPDHQVTDVIPAVA